MKKYLLAGAVASSALLALSVQAAPASSDASGVKGQVNTSVEKVWHCRAWSGGWGCGGGGGYHSRRWSHRRHGSWGW